MVAKNDRTVTVFGGTGFLGRRIVRYLRSCGFPVRVASRHPDRGHRLFGTDDPQLQSVEANIHDERSVAEALAGAYGVVNAVSLYVERGQQTFHSVHVEAAQRVAAQARRGRSRTAGSRFRNRRRCCLTIPLHPKARRRRTGGPGRVRRCTFRPPGCDVRVGRRVSHQHPQAASAASNLSDVRPRPDQIATGLCGRRCGSGCSSHAASRDAFDNIRVRRPARLLLRAISQSRSAPSWPRAPIDSNPACRLAGTGMGLRNLPKPAPHAQSSGTDANRHRVIAGKAWIC
jgi:hypothetical protein